MNNIFNNAYFGKAYKTRDERKALYHCFDGQYHRLFTEERCDFSPYCDDNGKHLTHSEEESRFDIISEWKEPIDEEELDALAEEYDSKVPHFINCDTGYTINYRIKEAYKAGCRKGYKDKK